MMQRYDFVTLLAILSSVSVAFVIYSEPAPFPVLPKSPELLLFDPSRNITCLGAHTDIPWNLRDEQYDGRSMQKLCADPLYGGSNIAPNFRGYCHNGDVFFGPKNLLRKPKNWYARSLLECRNRCFCNSNLEDQYQQPKEVADTRRTYLQRYNDWRTAISVDRQTFPQSRFGSMVTEIYYYNHTYAIDYIPGVMQTRPSESVGIILENSVECGGPLPSFSIPNPFDTHDYRNNQELCAAQLAGGNPAANAGAYCHRIDSRERVLSFADDMTPRLDWTWSGATGSDFFLAAAVRFHCWKNCRCRHSTTIKNYFDPSIRMWEFLLERLPPGDVMPVGSGNLYPMGSSTDSKGKPRAGYQPGSGPSTACSTNASDLGCIVPWPTELLGPVPGQVLALGTLKPAPPGTAILPEGKMCGNACSTTGDCGLDCICRVPSVDEAHALGVDPIAPTSLCLTLASIFG